MEYIQESFGSGLNSVALDFKIQNDAYVWGINSRSRFSSVDPLNKHLEIPIPPGNRLQGGIGVGNVLIAFVDGKAYFREEGEDTWHLIPLFQMSTTARRLWSIAVPASNMNFVRKLDVNANIKSDIQLTTDFKIAGTPAAIVVQDGIHQPWLIIYDTVNQVFTARQAKTYSQWNNKSITNDDREYVPRGKFMFFKNNILFITSIDGKRVYRSVSGRPLDFVINIDINGNKAPLESDGGAEKLSFAFDFDFITGIYDVNIPNSFAYTTAKNVRIITMDYTRTLFGEPTFFASAKIEAGVVNENSFIDILGDYAFVDREGIISFNAVEQLQQNGRNSIFSLNISKFLEKQKQTRPFAFHVNNYAIFNVDSKHSNIMCVYDTLLEKWVSIDITDVCRIKEVAYVETPSETKVYMFTEFNEIFLFNGIPDEYYLCQIKTRAHVPEKTNSEHKSRFFRTMFVGDPVDDSAEATVIEYVDDIKGQKVNQTLNGSRSGHLYPIFPPVIPHTHRQTDNPQYTLTEGQKGKKISFVIQWQSGAKLSQYQFVSNETTSSSSVTQANSYIETV